MAIVKGGLFSLGATGQLGKTIVYFNWKGKQAVRSHVMPTNPNTTNQQIQRGHLTSANAEWAAVQYSAVDQAAWNRYANTLAQTMSGFNAFCRSHMKKKIAGYTWITCHAVLVTSVTSTGAAIAITKVSGGSAPYVNLGVSPTSMPTRSVMTDATGNSWTKSLTGLTPSTIYYFFIDVVTSTTNYGRTGIYTFTTLA